jgi:N-acyl-L-homoserine lactone synthetase
MSVAVVDVASAIDAWVEATLAQLAPLEVVPARSAAERDAAFRLRARAVVECGWRAASAFPDGREHDADDADAIHLLAYDRAGGSLVGTIRLVPPAPGRRLPTERHFRLSVPVPSDVIDGGRLVVTPERRGARAHGVLMALFCGCWREGRARGFSRFLAVAPPGLAELYRQLGLTVTELGPAQDHWGEQRVPLLLGGDERTLAQPPERHAAR